MRRGPSERSRRPGGLAWAAAVAAATVTLLVSGCADPPAAPVYYLPRAVAGDPYPVARAIGRGVNFGNILEAPYEGAWQPPLSAALFDAAQAAGVQTIRLPVRWSAHALPSAPYTIDTAFFARVDYALDQAARRGLGVIVDMHNYHQLDGDATDVWDRAVAPQDVEPRFVAMWEQIVARYRNRPADVLFELYNEPHGAMTAERWNTLVQRTLVAVRAIDTLRYLVVGPVNWNQAASLPDLFITPKDRRILVTIHDYEPFAFTHQKATWAGMGDSPTTTCCTADQVAAFTAPLDAAQRWASRTTAPSSSASSARTAPARTTRA